MMLKKIVACVTLLFLLNSVTSFAKIQDKNIYTNIYKGCLTTINKEFSSDVKTSYCGCTARIIMDYFTVKELMLLEAEVINMNEVEKLKFAIANDKIFNIFSTCMADTIK